MRFLKNILKFVLFSCIDFTLLIFRRDKNIVVCTGWGGKRFADNSRYIFLYLVCHKKQYDIKDVIWITQDIQIKKYLEKSGYKVCMKNSWKSIYYHLHAYYFFYDQFKIDYYYPLIRKARLINLWHGMPIKKFGAKNGKLWDLKDDYLFTCSSWGDKTIGTSFVADPKRFVHGMYPRNYYLMHSIPYLTEEEQFYMNKIMKQKQMGKSLVFYLPTFRKSKLMFLGESEGDKIHDFFSFLEQNNIFLFTKLHYFGYFNHNDSIKISNSNFLNLSSLIDIYPFLKEADILITDYSSVFFDYLYLNRPIICYPYDLLTYQDEDQGLLFDYSLLPAEKAYSLEELKELLLKTISGKDLYKEDRKNWLYKSFGNFSMNDTIKNIIDL